MLDHARRPLRGSTRATGRLSCPGHAVPWSRTWWMERSIAARGTGASLGRRASPARHGIGPGGGARGRARRGRFRWLARPADPGALRWRRLRPLRAVRVGAVGPIRCSCGSVRHADHEVRPVHCPAVRQCPADQPPRQPTVASRASSNFSERIPAGIPEIGGLARTGTIGATSRRESGRPCLGDHPRPVHAARPAQRRGAGLVRHTRNSVERTHPHGRRGEGEATCAAGQLVPRPDGAGTAALAADRAPPACVDRAGMTFVVAWRAPRGARSTSWPRG